MRATILSLLALLAGVAALSTSAAYGGVGGCHGDFTADAAVEVALTKNCFQPTVVRVSAGDTVTWTNEDDVAHTVTSAHGSFGGSGELRKGDDYSQTFETQGVFPYFCTFHPSMVGAVVVGFDATNGEASAALTAASSSGGSSTQSVAAIAIAVGVAGAALGLVSTRLLSGRWKNGS